MAISLHAVIFDLYGFFTYQILALTPTAAATALTVFVFYSKGELSPMQVTVRYILQMLLVAIIVILAGTYADWIDWSNPKTVLLLLLCIGVIFVVSHLLLAFQNKIVSEKLTSKLRDYNKDV
jgi:hypothetical protein